MDFPQCQLYSIFSGTIVFQRQHLFHIVLSNLKKKLFETLIVNKKIFLKIKANYTDLVKYIGDTNFIGFDRTKKINTKNLSAVRKISKNHVLKSSL